MSLFMVDFVLQLRTRYSFLKHVHGSQIHRSLICSHLLIFSKVFAMPETALGLFPDIGASYFLSRLPGFFGN